MQQLFHKGRAPSGRPVKGWMESPDHKDAIIDPSVKYMGCAIGSKPTASSKPRDQGKRDYSYICAFIRNYKDGCFSLTTTDYDCGIKTGCISKTTYVPSC